MKEDHFHTIESKKGFYFQELLIGSPPMADMGIKMKFELVCEKMDGLVLIDKGCLKELDSLLLYTMDILLDSLGNSELVYDFPNEKWENVRLRETKPIREFCNSGKMIVWLLNDVEQECVIEYESEISNAVKWLHIPTGRLLAITASELIQCLSYPELDMNTIFELEVDAGWYAISNKHIDKIIYSKKEPQKSPFQNIEELYNNITH